MTTARKGLFFRSWLLIFLLLIGLAVAAWAISSHLEARQRSLHADAILQAKIDGPLIIREIGLPPDTIPHTPLETIARLDSARRRETFRDLPTSIEFHQRGDAAGSSQALKSWFEVRMRDLGWSKGRRKYRKGDWTFELLNHGDSFEGESQRTDFSIALRFHIHTPASSDLD